MRVMSSEERLETKSGIDRDVTTRTKRSIGMLQGSGTCADSDGDGDSDVRDSTHLM